MPRIIFRAKKRTSPDEGIAVAAQNKAIARFTLNGGLFGVDLGGPQPNFSGVSPEPRLALKGVIPPDEGINCSTRNESR
jgi:hypothetical protein